jgi:hypothetical protein
MGQARKRGTFLDRLRQAEKRNDGLVKHFAENKLVMEDVRRLGVQRLATMLIQQNQNESNNT